jgi:hypothetical protein
MTAPTAPASTPLPQNARTRTHTTAKTAGELRSYEPGADIVRADAHEQPGVFIVIGGLVRMELERGNGVETHYAVGLEGGALDGRRLSCGSLWA